ncbi:MAG: metallophosphoesterase [Planctomycetes bacterium]|nr:metallophosphoesterase [Planctomycetota bacterium]
MEFCEAEPEFMIAVQLMLYLPALMGHLVLWVAIFNRLHSTGLRHRPLKLLEKLIFLAILAIPALFGFWLWRAERTAVPVPSIGQLLIPVYTGVCWLTLLIGIPCWWRYRTEARRQLPVVAQSHKVVDVAARIGDRPVGNPLTWISVRLPGNEVYQLHVSRKQLWVPRLPPRLEGLSIAHLSDLHFSGRILPPYFQVVIDETNELDADVVMISGDIVDRAECIDWIPATLGRLRSRYGMYFVLGNHDRRVARPQDVRNALADCGFVDLGGRVERRQFRDAPVLLAGNEAPWFYPLPACPPREDGAGENGNGSPLRLLLSHAPDQIPWARAQAFDLMLAGHTHGGQIQFPGIGPTVSPSRFGIRYASGSFYEAPTVMHVSRGISGLHTIRFRCPPELALLTLTRGSGDRNDARSNGSA